MTACDEINNPYFHSGRRSGKTTALKKYMEGKIGKVLVKIANKDSMPAMTTTDELGRYLKNEYRRNGEGHWVLIIDTEPEERRADTAVTAGRRYNQKPRRRFK